VNGYDAPSGLAISRDGTKVVVTGVSSSTKSTFDAGFAFDYRTIAYNVSTGAMLWTSRYNGPWNNHDRASAVAISPDGSKVIVTGDTAPDIEGPTDYATIAYSASTGATLWTRLYNGPGNGWDSARSLAISADGTKVIVTGESDGGLPSHEDYSTIPYNTSTGVTLWAKRYHGGYGGDYPKHVAISSDGTRVIVTGTSESASIRDFLTIAYNASTGATLWTKRHSGPGRGPDSPDALAISQDGTRVIVAGDSDGGLTDYDYLTTALNASTGELLWAKRYNGPVDRLDSVTDVAIRPDGLQVIVTGASDGGVTRYDYLTIAYAM
jgi:DNA-binding beta-propeller fold protein YncE